VGAHQDAVQRAVVLILAVIGALLHGAGNTFVGIVFHDLIPPSFWIRDQFSPAAEFHAGICFQSCFFFASVIFYVYLNE
jgi:hypothetical protein